MKYIIPIICVFSFMCDAYSAVKIKNSTADRYEEQIAVTKGEEVGADEAADIATLENDIRILDEEIAKCKKQKKGWIAATVIGAAGTVATGVAAGVQAVKLKDTKDERNVSAEEVQQKRQELQNKKDELNNLNGDK